MNLWYFPLSLFTLINFIHCFLAPLLSPWITCYFVHFVLTLQELVWSIHRNKLGLSLLISFMGWAQHYLTKTVLWLVICFQHLCFWKDSTLGAQVHISYRYISVVLLTTPFRLTSSLKENVNHIISFSCLLSFSNPTLYTGNEFLFWKHKRFWGRL